VNHDDSRALYDRAVDQNVGSNIDIPGTEPF
jgi:hypothetical protein